MTKARNGPWWNALGALKVAHLPGMASRPQDLFYFLFFPLRGVLQTLATTLDP